MPGRIRNKIIFIFCEGKENKTERYYFEGIKQEQRLSNYKIKIKHKTGKSDPEGLVKYAKSLVRTKEIDFRLGDLAWCVFDVDTDPKNPQDTQQKLYKARKMAGKNIQIFLSNPSFELWYLLHFELYKGPMNNEELMNRLKSPNNIPDYAKNKCYYQRILEKQPDAIINAKALESMHMENGLDLYNLNSNPYTEIYKIIENIKNIT